jgi:polypeptide N-acetylgalactosaminyltransferase
VVLMIFLVVFSFGFGYWIASPTILPLEDDAALEVRPVNSRHYSPNDLRVLTLNKRWSLSNLTNNSVSTPSTQPHTFIPPIIRTNLTENEERELKDAGFSKHKFNQFVSDRLPLRKDSPHNVRPSLCDSVVIDVANLPPTSVVILFHNEARSTLLRTVWSVLDSSPEHLIEEILLIDDGSTDDWIKDGDLEAEINTISAKVKLVHTNERVGLIRGRMIGVQHSKAPVVTFLDSHCECSKGWLEPMLDRIHLDPTIVVSPVIDIIDKNTFDYKPINDVLRGGFTWALNFKWIAMTTEQRNARKSSISPLRSPTMAGGLFAIHKQFFTDIGLYDELMDVWGGENLELSFRIWQCGGTLEINPCSHVGHVFRDQHPYSFPGGNAGNTITKNLNRLAEVFLFFVIDILKLCLLHLLIFPKGLA